MKFDIVVCTDNFGGIGINGSLPWIIKKDLQRFKELTMGGTVIMGRKTWDSLHKNFKPLPGRHNFILSKNDLDSELENYRSNSLYKIKSFNNLDEALENAYTPNKIFIIGGGILYGEALKHNKLRHIYMTKLEDRYSCDTYFFMKNTLFEEVEKSENITENEISFKYIKYQRKNSDEKKYLCLMEKILNQGVDKIDRTKIGIRSLFGEKLEFDLKSGFPLITTKKTFFRAIVEELLFFISGKTDSKILSNKGVKIWEGNTTRDFLNSRGLDYEEGFMGPMYSWQWRHAGKEYEGKDIELGEGGIDQLQNVIDLIKNDPGSRRILVNSHDTANLDKCVLMCCHTMFQFWVDTDKKELSCQMYQRSADMFLGVPFNIASYALLTEMISHICDLKPGKLSIVFGDCHIYNNHFEQVKEQIKRMPYSFPELKIKREIKNINDFKYEDFDLIEYISHPKIKADMAC